MCCKGLPWPALPPFGRGVSLGCLLHLVGCVVFLRLAPGEMLLNSCPQGGSQSWNGFHLQLAEVVNHPLPFFLLQNFMGFSFTITFPQNFLLRTSFFFLEKRKHQNLKKPSSPQGFARKTFDLLSSLSCYKGPLIKLLVCQSAQKFPFGIGRCVVFDAL